MTITNLSVSCPTCQAPIGASCRNARGQALRSCSARMRAARVARSLVLAEQCIAYRDSFYAIEARMDLTSALEYLAPMLDRPLCWRATGVFAERGSVEIY